MQIPVRVKLRSREEWCECRVISGMGTMVRVDYAPEIKGKKTVTENVMEKILFRGKNFAKLSPKLIEKIEEICVRNDVIRENRKKVLHKQWHDGVKRENLGGMSVEEYVYKKIIVPEVMKCGGKEGDTVPQMRMGELMFQSQKNRDERRVDFSIKIGEATLVVEVDDVTHKGREVKDEVRDEELWRNRVRVIRVRDDELEGKGKDEIQQEIRRLYKLFVQEKQGKNVKNRLKQIVFLMQAMLMVAMSEGKIKNGMKIFLTDDCFPEINPKIKDELMQTVLEDMMELEENIAEIYGEKRKLEKIEYSREEAEVIFTANKEKDYAHREQIMIQEIGMNVDVVNVSENETEKVKNVDAKRENLEFLLKYIFSHEGFRPNQIDGVQRVLGGKDTIVLLPTGSGKSVIYQLCAMIMPGTVLIIEPLKSLMEDQMNNLRRNGIENVGMFSGEIQGVRKEMANRMLKMGAYAMVYITPERLQLEKYRKIIREAGQKGVNFPMCALDEAHCVSEWGHDFRVAYLNIAETCRKVCGDGEKKPVILALTGTASDNVLKDMERDIGIDDEGVIRPASFDRPEIHYKVFSVGSNEKMAALKWLLDKEIPKDFGVENAEELMRLNGEETMAGIVFCVYKSGKTDFGVDTVFEELNKSGYTGVTRYYATNTDAERVKGNAEDFKENKASLMVATKAFGMGIDKPNVRYTIHFGIPSSIEAFYQEAGRAGRDGQKSMSYVILSNDAPERNGELIKQDDMDDLKKNLRKIGTRKADDVNRLLYLHQMNYDKKQTMNDMTAIMMLMGEIKEKNANIVATSDLEFARWQKVFYRLKILTVIEDYTIVSYANNEFVLKVNEFSPQRVIEAYKKYVAQYQEGQVQSEVAKLRGMKFVSKDDFVTEMMRMLLDFVNNVFENSRRRAIGNMLQLAEEVVEAPIVKQDEVMRKKILGHLGNIYKEMLLKIIGEANGMDEAVMAIRTSKGQTEEVLLMEARRALQTYPEHPGLLLVTGCLGAIDEETNPIVAKSDMMQAFYNAMEKYNMERELMEKVMGEMVILSLERGRDEKKMMQFLDLMLKELPQKIKKEISDKIPAKYAERIVMEKMQKEMLRVLEYVKEEDLWTRAM